MVKFSKDTDRVFLGDRFALGDSGASGLVPVHALSHTPTHRTLELQHAGSILYRKPECVPEMYRGHTGNSDLGDLLHRHVNVRAHDFTVGGIRHRAFACRGYIEDHRGRVLFVACARISGNTCSNVWGADFPTTEQLVLFVAHDLVTSPAYKNVYRKLQKNCLLPAHENGAEVVYDTPRNIRERVYRNRHRLRFKNLAGLQGLLDRGLKGHMPKERYKR